MLKFFRTIRKKLIEEDNIRKYLLYAVGEILLVVIGILIALQINTWNENRKRSDLEKYLLKELKNEVSENLFLINTDIATNTTGLEHSLVLMGKVVTNDLETNPKLTDSLIAGIYETSSFEPKSGVITDIINTGKLDVIKNDSLRILVSNWDFHIIDMMDDAKIRDDMLFNHLLPFLSRNYPLLNIHPYVEPYVESSEISKIWDSLSSDSKPDYNMLYSMETQGMLYNHAINQEYLLNALRIYKRYLEGMRALINEEIERA